MVRYSTDAYRSNRIYQSMGLPLGFHITRLLRNKDKEKLRRHNYRKTKKYKAFRKAQWTKKYKLLQEEQMKYNKDGKTYEAGMALSLARSRVKVQ